MTERRELDPALVTTQQVQESFMYAQLHANGHGTNEFGTAFTVAKSRAFDVWLESVKREAWHSVAPLIECERCGHQWT